jgi:hypothetical protein
MRALAGCAALAALLAGCGKSSDPDPHGNGTGGAGGQGGVVLPEGGDAGAGGGASGTGGVGPTGGSAGTGGMEDGGDAGWQAVPWAPADCMYVADDPALAVPELEWTNCGTGCSRLVPNWLSKSGIPLQTAQVYKAGSTLRLGLHMWVGEPGYWRKAIYDENWKPLAVWKRGAALCGANLLQWTPKHVCLSIGTGLEPTLQAFLDPTNLSGPPKSFYATESIVPLACDEELFVGSSSGGIPYVRDLQSGFETWIQPPVGRSFDARLAGEHLLLVVEDTSGANVKLTGWIWKRPNTLEQLVDPGSEVIYDMRSDGQTLVWVQVSSAALGTLAPGTLWTSPFATSAAEVKGTARRATPPMYLAESSKTANQGFYALIEQASEGNDAERHVHVYRLSDARHWAVPQISDVKPSKMIYIDSEEVWYLGATLNGAPSTIIRQRLDALGPGD